MKIGYSLSSEELNPRDMVRWAREAEDAGFSSDEVQSALNQAPLPVKALEPIDARRHENSTIAFIGVLYAMSPVLRELRHK